MTEMTDEAAITGNLDFSFLDSYKEAAAEATRLIPAKYYAEIPTGVTATVKKDKAGRVGLEFPLGQLRIVADKDGTPVTGFVNKFYKVDTFLRGGIADAIDLVRLFGIDPKTLVGETLEETKTLWNMAFETLAGQRTPVPIRFDYRASYKHPISGQWINLNGKAFRRGEDDYAGAGYLLPVEGGVEFVLDPPFPASVPKNDYKAQAAYAKANWGPNSVVYANFGPAYKAWQTKA